MVRTEERTTERELQNDLVGFGRPVPVAAHRSAEQHIDPFRVWISRPHQVAEDDYRMRLFVLKVVRPDVRNAKRTALRAQRQGAGER